MNKMYFKMFPNCIVVKGKNKSVVLDIQRENYTTIPDTMEEIIELFNSKKTIEQIYNLYDAEDKTIIDEYLEFLTENEFGLYTDSDEFDRFIDIDKSFELPSDISNCIIEISPENLFFITKIVNELEKLFCKNIQFISYQYIEIKDLIHLLESTSETNFSSIELILKNSEEIIKFIPEIDKYNFRVTQLTLYNSKSEILEYKNTTFAIKLIDYEIKNFANCGLINTDYFEVSKPKVLESLNHNSCLNKKLSIDKDGNIKNCPSMPESYGNIKNTTLEEALNQPDFKKYWNINKDQIEICKDCEFRHICTDCRAYIEKPENIYSKPLKCGYNPYTNEWSEWSTNPLKKKVIEYYGMQDLIKKNA